MQVDRDIKIISLFSGCGGLDLGFEGDFDVLKKSINPRLHSDLIKFCKNTDNGSKFIRLPKTIFSTVFANDILKSAKSAWIPYFENKYSNNAQYSLESIVELVKESKNSYESVFPKADIVTGGFPCQDFSVAGKRLGFNSHKGHHGDLLKESDNPSEENRGKLYYWMREAIGIIKPKLFIAENVKGLISLANVRKIIENDFASIEGNGYLVISKLLRAADYGVPQYRDRIIFMGFNKKHLSEQAFEDLKNINRYSKFYPFPPRTHVPQKEYFQSSNLLPYVTVSDAIDDLPEPHESKDLTHHSYSRAKWYGKGIQGQTEVNLNDVGPTIRAEHHGNIEFRRLSKEHGGKIYSELVKGLMERRLSVRECARLQTFPDDFIFVRKQEELGRDFSLTMSDGYKLIGNAVPPLLGFNIAWHLQNIWEDLFIK